MGNNVGGQTPTVATGSGMGMKVGLGVLVLAVLVGGYMLMGKQSNQASNETTTVENEGSQTGSSQGVAVGEPNGKNAGTITSVTNTSGTAACDKFISVAELESILGTKFLAPVSGAISMNGSATSISGCTWKLASDPTKQIGFGYVDGTKMNIPVASIEQSLQLAIQNGGASATIKKLNLPDHGYIATETNGDTTGLIFKTTSYGGVTAHGVGVSTVQMSQILVKINDRI